MPYSFRKIQLVASRLFCRYNHLFVDSVKVSWLDIGVLDELPLEWVKIWEGDSENLGWGQTLEDIQEENRLLYLGWVIGAGVGEDGAEEKLKEARRKRVVEKELWDWEEEGDISEDEKSDSGEEEIEGSKNGEKTELSLAYAQQAGNDDEDWDKKIEELEERLSIFEDFVDR